MAKPLRRVPLSLAPERPAGPPAAAHALAPAPSRAPLIAPVQARVLVVDDTPEVLDLIAALLSRMKGVETRLATEATMRRALARIEHAAFDVVVADCRLEEGDGFAVLEGARRTNPSGTRILITGYADVPTPLERVRAARVDAYLAKPLRIDAFAALLDACARRDADALASTRARSREIEARAEAEGGRLRLV